MSSRVILALRVARPLLYQISGPRNMCARTCQWFKPLGFLLTSFCMSCARPIHPISFFYSESLTHSSFLPINLSLALLKAWLHFLLMIYCHSECFRRSNLYNTEWGMHMRQFPSDFCLFFSFNIQVYFPGHFILIFQFFSLSGPLFLVVLFFKPESFPLLFLDLPFFCFFCFDIFGPRNVFDFLLFVLIILDFCILLLLKLSKLIPYIDYLLFKLLSFLK